MKKLVKKILGLTLSVAMVATSVNVSNIAVKADGYKETGTKLTGGTNVTLSSGTYYLDSNVIYNPATTGSSGLTIASGATVKIYLNGHSITATGSAATAGTAGGAGSMPGVSVGNTANGGTAGTGGTKGYAGIKLPENATLIVIGKGTVNATGGAGGQGGAGGNGGSGAISKNYESSRAGSGGGGGAGGGGAGAGIGTDGTNGTDGSAGGQGKTIQANVRDWNTPTASGGTSGSSNSANSGKFYTYSDYSGAITVNAQGGAAGNTSSAGTAGTSGTDSGSNWDDDFTASGGAGGASGGGGGKAMNIGPGGTGGTGGTGGASGASNYENSGFVVYYGYGGAAGQGGSTNGIGGNNGGTANNTAAYDIDGDRAYPDYTLKGSQSTAGTAGTRGSVGTLRNLYLTGVYVKMKDSTKEYAVDDYITEDDIDVYAVYNTSTAATFDQTKELSTYYNTSMGDWTGAPNGNGWYARPVTSDYYSIVGAETTGEHAGEFKVTQALALSMMATDETSTPEGKVEVKLDDVSAAAHSKGFIGDLQIDVTTSETTEGTDKGDDNTEQEDLYGYPEDGNAARFNQLPAVKTMTYDGLYHSISQLIQNTGYGANNGATSTFAITDSFFAKGLNSSPTETSYWMYGYAMSPYYRVSYHPYIAYNQYDDRDQYLTGDAYGVEIPGKNARYSYYAAGQINSQLIKNAGYYTVEVVVPYRYKVYRFFRLWSTYKYFYRTYKFNILVRKAELDIGFATDTVHENTKVQNHTYTRNVEGQNEDVYGEFLYSSTIQNWDNNEARSANEFTDIIEDIAWEFNVYYPEDKNNYLCQIDGTHTFDDWNTYYRGTNGVLIYTPNPIGTRTVDSTLFVDYQDEQSQTGELTDRDYLKTAILHSEDTEVALQSVYAEELGITGYINRNSTSLGFRAKFGDAVTGDTTLGTKIEDASSMPEGYKQYYNIQIADGKYLGDKFITKIMAGDKLIFAYVGEAYGDDYLTYLPAEYTDKLPACEYYGVDHYDVVVDYIGLYYTTETSASGRRSDWSGDEEFNWVTSKTTFTLDVNQRNVKINPLDDINKIYDGTDMIVSQTVNANRDVTAAAGYVIDVKTTLDDESQFAKKATTTFFNYYDPTYLGANAMTLEISGTYNNKNKGEQKTATIVNARLGQLGEDPTYLNYNIDGLPATVTGDVDVANMYFTHKQFGTMNIYDSSVPMHDILEVSSKAYLLHTELDKDGYVVPAETSYDELVEKNDARAYLIRPFVPAEVDPTFEYDYDAGYILVSNEYSPEVLDIDEQTGAITTVATSTKGGNNATQFPSVLVLNGEHGNFTNVQATETIETDTYNECHTFFKNDLVESDEMTVHQMRYRIIGNYNTYDVILPGNQLNNAGKYSGFVDKYTDYLVNGDEYYEYMTIYEEGDQTSFYFTIPQNSYLEDLAIVDLGDYKTYSEETIDNYANIRRSRRKTSLGTFNTQEETLNANDDPLYLTLDTIGEDECHAIPDPDAQIGGSTFGFTIKTGNSVLGNNKAIAIVPIIREYDLISDRYRPKLKVEETLDENGEAIAGIDDNVYINFKTKFYTDALEETEKYWGEVALSYETEDETTVEMEAPFDTTLAGIHSYGIDTEDEKYADFFAPDKLVPGTKVDIAIKVWRDGITEGLNDIGVDDPDAFEIKHFVWRVTIADYVKLFDDQTVMFRTSNSTDTLFNIKAFGIYEENDDGTAAVQFGKVAKLVEKGFIHWHLKEDVNMLDIADTWYLTGEEAGTRVVIANDPENDYPIASVAGEAINTVPLGSSFFPTYEIAEVYTVDTTKDSIIAPSRPGYVRVLFGGVDLYGKVQLSYTLDRITGVKPYEEPEFEIKLDYNHTKPYTAYEWFGDEEFTQPLVDGGLPVTAKDGDKFYLKAAKNYVEFVVGEDVVGYGFYDDLAYPYTVDFTQALFTTTKPVACVEDKIVVTDMSEYTADKYTVGEWYYDPEFTMPVEDLSQVILTPTNYWDVPTLYLRPIYAEEVQLNDIEFIIDETVTPDATVLPEDALDRTVTYYIEDETIATIDENNVITGHAVGTTTITAVSNDSDKVFAVANLTVKPRLVERVEVSFGGKMTVGDTKQFTAKVVPENATDTSVTWKSSNESVATVDANGNVKAIAYGTATITATSNDEAKIVGATSVSVNDVPISPAEIEANSIDINKGISAVATSSGIDVGWHAVKDAEEYRVFVQLCAKPFDQGTICTVGKDITKIKIKKVNGKKISNKKNYKVVVKAYKTINGKKTMIAKSIVGHFVSAKNKKYSNPAKIKLKKTSFTLAVGKTATIKGKVKLQKKKRKMLSSRHAPTFRYSTSDASIAKVSNKGVITAVSKGSTTIYVYAKNGLPKAVKVTVR